MSSPAINTASLASITPTDFTVTIDGSNFVEKAEVLLGGTTVLPTIFFSGTQLRASLINVAPNTTYSLVVMNPDGGTSNTVQVASSSATKDNITATARFLDQASWGPNAASISHVQQIGMNVWIDEQSGTAQTIIPNPPNPLPSYCADGISCVQQSFFQAAISGPDQLRQRVGFALSKIWVISGVEITSSSAFPAYLNMLNGDAFSNYLQIMKDVTLFPGMAQYLTMANSDKPAPGLIANENYARELMQLFTLGTKRLNDDGTPVLDSQGNPVQPYSEADVEATALALTGWTYPKSDGSIPVWPNRTPYNGRPMVAIDAHHDTTAKTLINGTVLPAGQTAQQDLDGALQAIFNHPNLPPFVSRQLIQQLVTSNPSPAYIQRVARVFENNGSGVRGDMKAVVKAILLDDEARRGDIPANAAANDGHLREPVAYEISLLRALNAAKGDPAAFASTLAGFGQNMGQRVLYPGSVFSYFSPDYVIPGTSLYGPEFQILTTATSTVRKNFVNTVVRNQIGGGVVVELTPYANLAGNPQLLVDTLDNVLTHGALPSADKSAIVTAVNAVPSSNPQARARVAVYLFASSPQYQIR